MRIIISVIFLGCFSFMYADQQQDWKKLPKIPIIFHEK